MPFPLKYPLGKNLNCMTQKNLKGMTYQDGNLYDRIKTLGDSKYHIPTQCVQRKTLFKGPQGPNLQVIFIRIIQKIERKIIDLLCSLNRVKKTQRTIRTKLALQFCMFGLTIMIEQLELVKLTDRKTGRKHENKRIIRQFVNKV